MPTYPNVPNVPGVPPVPRDPQAPIAENIILAVSDAIIIAKLFIAPQWGLFNDDGTNALNVSSTVSVEMRGDAAVTTAPQEAGGFVSYNKVQVPQMIRMTFSVSNGSFLPPGGAQLATIAGLGSFFPTPDDLLATLEGLRDQPILLTAVTPNAVYPNVTVMHYEYRRTAQSNATKLDVDVWVQEIRLPGTAQFDKDNTESPSSPDPVNGGTVQPGPVVQFNPQGGGGVS
jgi:hypothetical protein